MIILLIHPGGVTDRGVGENLKEATLNVGGFLVFKGVGPQVFEPLGLLRVASENRSSFGQRRRRHLGHYLVVVGDPQSVSGSDGAYNGGVDLPFGGDRQHLVDVRRINEGHHSLLRFRHEEFGGAHAEFADVNSAEVHVHAGPGPGSRFGCGT